MGSSSKTRQTCLPVLRHDAIPSVPSLEKAGESEREGEIASRDKIGVTSTVGIFRRPR